MEPERTKRYRGATGPGEGSISALPCARRCVGGDLRARSLWCCEASAFATEAAATFRYPCSTPARDSSTFTSSGEGGRGGSGDIAPSASASYHLVSCVLMNVLGNWIKNHCLWDSSFHSPHQFLLAYQDSGSSDSASWIQNLLMPLLTLYRKKVTPYFIVSVTTWICSDCRSDFCINYLNSSWKYGPRCANSNLISCARPTVGSTVLAFWTDVAGFPFGSVLRNDEM